MFAFFIAVFLTFTGLAVFASPVDVNMNNYMHARYLTTSYQDLGTCQVIAPTAATSTVGGVVATTTAIGPTTYWSSVALGTLTATVTQPCVAAREQTTIVVSFYCGKTKTVTRTKTFTDPDVTRYVPTHTATVTSTTTYAGYTGVITTICA